MVQDRDGVASRATWLESHDREKDIYYVGGYPVTVVWDTDADEFAAALVRASLPSPSTGTRAQRSPVIGTTVARTSHHSRGW